MGPGRDYQVSPLDLPANFKTALESHVMLGFTGLTRIASDIAQEQIENIRTGSNKSQLSEIHDIAKEALKNFRGRPDLREIGSLLDRSWQLKRSMSRAISTDSVDLAFAKAQRLGAYGGKLMGAGGGGFLFFLAPPEIQSRIKHELKDLIKVWVPFRFDEHGAQVLLHRNQPVEVL
jgi:D-glycero-alpha-D-manno-heptose-7-phosphate kinase